MASGYPIFGSKLSYVDYLVAHEFVGDITSSNRRISMDISCQTRDVIASNEALSRENIRATEIAAGQITDAVNSGFGELSSIMQDGFSQITYEMQEISAGIAELNATFHWGFGRMIASMGRMNDALAELIKIAKTPAQTAAYEQYEIARDAFRQELYQECLDSLEKAISGDHTSTGYKLEWRFHQMKGTLRLGFVNGDMTLVDLAAAEESFALAARYAKTDYPEHAAQAFLSAGWAAYWQGKLKDGLAYTEQALAISPNLGEALFQAAKVRMALGEVDTALPALAKAINIDRFYSLKAAGDGDFQRHDDKLREFLEGLRNEKYRTASSVVQKALNDLSDYFKSIPSVDNDPVLTKWKNFIENGKSMPLLDIINLEQGVASEVAEFRKIYELHTKQYKDFQNNKSLIYKKISDLHDLATKCNIIGLETVPEQRFDNVNNKIANSIESAIKLNSVEEYNNFNTHIIKNVNSDLDYILNVIEKEIDTYLKKENDKLGKLRLDRSYNKDDRIKTINNVSKILLWGGIILSYSALVMMDFKTVDRLIGIDSSGLIALTMCFGTIPISICLSKLYKKYMTNRANNHNYVTIDESSLSEQISSVKTLLTKCGQLKQI
jgi:tetratricopeptide (TPR) repeat protein